MAENNAIIIWYPLDEEHDLAIQHGLIQLDKGTYDAVIKEFLGGYESVKIKIFRWPVSKVLKGLNDFEKDNTPTGRAQLFAEMAITSEPSLYD